MADIAPSMLSVEDMEAIDKRVKNEFQRLNKATEERDKLWDQIDAKMEELRKEKALLDKTVACTKRRRKNHKRNLMISTSIGAAIGAFVMSIYLNHRKHR